MNLLVVIVNYKTADLTVDCLRSLAPQLATIDGTSRVVVTDNASGDGSVEKIQAAITENGWDWATLLPLPSNGGFAYGNNRAIEPALQGESKPDYVFLLNPDTDVLPGALKALVDFMEAHHNLFFRLFLIWPTSPCATARCSTS